MITYNNFICNFFRGLPIFQLGILIQINDEKLYFGKSNPNFNLCLYEYDPTYKKGEDYNSITFLLYFHKGSTISRPHSIYNFSYSPNWSFVEYVFNVKRFLP